MSILAATNGDCAIHYGDSGDNDIAKIIYSNNGDALRFFANADERMRINSGGRVSIGHTGNSHGLHLINNNGGNYVTNLVNSGTAPYGLKVHFSADDPDNTTRQAFIFVGDATTRAIMYSDGDWVNHDNSYSGISDERIKQDIKDLKKLEI